MGKGSSSLEVGIASRAAAIVFDRIREERGIVADQLKKGVGISGQERFIKMMSGRRVWTLDEVKVFADFLHIDLKIIFREIEKEIHLLTIEERRPAPNIEDSLVS